eukprot:s137_g17.t1
MSRNAVVVQCKVVNDEGFHMQQRFQGCDLLQCQCDPATHVTIIDVKVTNLQWNCVMAESEECLLIHARLDDGCLSTMFDDAAVIPVKPVTEPADDQRLPCGEIFSGGFSGWSHSVSALKERGMHLQHEWGLDRDAAACVSYSKTHCPTQIAQTASEAGEFFTDGSTYSGGGHLLFQTAVQNFWWMTFAGVFMTEAIFMSAPCPAWSLADAAPGLGRSDGFLFLTALLCVAMLRPRVLISENVASMKTHRHWKLVVAIIEWLNYRVHWNATLDLRDILPHARDRAILICRDARDYYIMRVEPLRWPVTRKHTLRTYGVVCDLDAFWKNRASLTEEEIRLYLNPANLPKEISRGHAKRSMRDVQVYRLRDLDSVFTCLMTSYGRPCALSGSLISRGGIYGSLLCLGSVLRKIVAPEMCILMGLLSKQWLPEPEFQSTTIMGNAISVPHALIGILNMLAILRDSWVLRGVPETFASVMHSAIKADSIIVVPADGGFMICRRDQVQESIPATFPMRTFGKLNVKSPLHSFVVHVETGVKILEILAKLTAESMPALLDVLVDGFEDVKFPLLASLVMTEQVIQIRTNVPSCLFLTETTVKAVDWPFVALLHRKGILVIERCGDFLGTDVKAALASFDPEWDSRLLDFAGRPIGDEVHPPNVVFLSKSCHVRDYWELLQTKVVFQKLAESFITSMPVRDVHAFIHWFDRTGILDAVRGLGWQFLVQLNNDADELPKDVLLMPVSGRLAVTPQAICQIIITKAFLNQLSFQVQQPQMGSKVLVSIKLWDSWMWEGLVGEDETTEFIHHAWAFAHEMFHDATPIRLVTAGGQVSPEWAIKHFMRTDSDGVKCLKLHVVLQLRGGGPKTGGRDHPDALPSAFSFDELEQMSHTEPGRLMSALVQNLINDEEAEKHMDLSFLRNATFQKTDVGFSLTGAIPTIVRLLRDMNVTGIERLLQALGWQAVLYFLECRSHPVVQLLILPRIGIRQLPRETVEMFLINGLTVRAMPMPSLLVRGIHVKVKHIDSWIVDGMFHPDTLVGDFLRPWTQATMLFHEPSAMRAVCHSKQAMPDRTISEYALQNEAGGWFIKMHLVLQLRGGGPSPGQPRQVVIKHKNDLARHLLEMGCSLDDVTAFADRLIGSAGAPAVAQCLKPKDTLTRSSNLEKLARSLKLQLPKHKPIESNIRKSVQKKVSAAGTSVEVFNANDFSIQPGFFHNQDGTQAGVCDSIKNGACGVALVNPSEAEPWVRQELKVTQDELALLILGKCPAESDQCSRLDVPACTRQGRPVLLSCCFHQLGQKDVTFTKPSDVAVDVEQTTVVAVTAFKDEMEGDSWEVVLKSPVKTVLDIIKTMGTAVETKSPPWGRSWRDASGNCMSSVAWSLQFHIRIATNKVPDMLKLSGQKGIYLSAKTEDKRTDPRYSVLWMDLPLNEIRVSAAASKTSLGLVKLVKGNGSRVSRGIRFRNENLAEAAKQLKPSANAPAPLHVKFTARLAPTPVGATFDTVKSWIDLKQWNAKPLKPLGPEMWLLGFSEKVTESWISWNGKMMLLTWNSDQIKKDVRPILAGHVQGLHKSKAEVVTQGDDPWANWYKNHGNPANATASTAVAPPPARPCEGPIEQRFAEQSAQFNELKVTVAEISRRMDTADEGRAELKKEMQTQISEVRDNVKSQMQTMTKHFDATLDSAMRRQDRQLESSFAELKALFQNRPLPAKKARVEKPKKDEEEELEEDEDGS